VGDGSVGGGLGLPVIEGCGLTDGDGAATGEGEDVGVGDPDGGGEADGVTGVGVVGGSVGSMPPMGSGPVATRPTPYRGAMKRSGTDAIAGSLASVRRLAAGSAAIAVGCGSAAAGAGATLGEGVKGPKDSELTTSPRAIATIVTATRTSSAVTAIATRA
jgi:hypothetical protein